MKEVSIGRVFSRPPVWVLLGGLGLFFLLFHNLKPYSDPYYFIRWAQEFSGGEVNSERALVYPAILGASLKVLGLAYSFLLNLPFHLLLMAAVCAVSAVPVPRYGCCWVVWAFFSCCSIT